MIVELFGPSGSGKSTIASRLAATHKLPLIRVGFGQKYPLALMFALGHPTVTARLWALWQRKTREDTMLRGKKFYRLVSFLAKEQKARLRGGGVIDEGLFQFFLILHERPIVPEDIEHCLSALPRDAYRIGIVLSDLPTRLARMHARGKVSRADRGDAYATRWHAMLDANAAALIPIFERMFRCIPIENRDDGTLHIPAKLD